VSAWAKGGHGPLGKRTSSVAVVYVVVAPVVATAGLATCGATSSTTTFAAGTKLREGGSGAPQRPGGRSARHKRLAEDAVNHPDVGLTALEGAHRRHETNADRPDWPRRTT
jgi:hypothetical protein